MHLWGVRLPISYVPVPKVRPMSLTSLKLLHAANYSFRDVNAGENNTLDPRSDCAVDERVGGVNAGRCFNMSRRCIDLAHNRRWEGYPALLISRRPCHFHPLSGRRLGGLNALSLSPISRRRFFFLHVAACGYYGLVSLYPMRLVSVVFLLFLVG